MVEVTVKIPEDIKEIITEISETIYLEAIKEVALRRIHQTQKRLKAMKKKILAFEKKYGKSYEEFSQNVPDTLKGHDDWIEWTYLVHADRELENKFEKIKLIVGK